MSRKRRGLERAFKQPEECWNASPPPSSAARSAMQFAGELYISLLKAVCAAATSNMVRAPCTSRFGLVGLRRVETHGAGPHKLLGSDPIDFRESLKIKAKRKIKAKVKRKDQPE